MSRTPKNIDAAVALTDNLENVVNVAENTQPLTPKLAA
jgi:hypothetical protein